MDTKNDLLVVLQLMDSPAMIVSDGKLEYQNPIAYSIAQSVGSHDLLGFIPTELLNTKENTTLSNIVIGNLNYNLTVSQVSLGTLCIFTLDTAKDSVGLTNVGIQLRTPFNSLISYISLLESRINLSADAKTPEFVAAINHNIARLIKLINNIADLEGFSNGSCMVSKQNLNIEDFCRQLVEEVNFIISSKDLVIDFVSELSSEQPLIVGFDKTKLERAIYNLISNAIKHLGGDKKITFQLSANDKHVFLSITNSGDEIPPEYMATIFTRYSSPELPFIHNSAAGLGLSIVQSIAKMHNGTVMISSDPQTGTKVIMSIENAMVLDQLSTPIVSGNTGGFPLVLVELSDVLSRDAFREQNT